MADMKKIETGYKKHVHIYDDALTSKTFLMKLYNRIVWGMDDKDYVGCVLDYIPKEFDGKLLDVPVGTGVHTYEKYSKVSDACITAVDYSESMLGKAQERLGKLQNVRLVQGDVGNLPFGNESFDLVFSMNGFHAFPDKQKAFQQTHRVLSEKGIFCGCFYIKGRRLLTDFFVGMLYVKKGWFSPPFYTLDELRKTLEGNYSKVEITCVKSIACFHCIK